MNSERYGKVVHDVLLPCVVNVMSVCVFVRDFASTPLLDEWVGRLPIIFWIKKSSLGVVMHMAKTLIQQNIQVKL